MKIPFLSGNSDGKYSKRIDLSKVNFLGADGEESSKSQAEHSFFKDLPEVSADPTHPKTVLIPEIQKVSIVSKVRNAYTEAKNKTIYGIKNTFVWIMGFGIVFGAVVLGTTNNGFIKEIYWNLGGGNQQLQEAQANLDKKRKEISAKTVELKMYKEEASGKFLELQATEIKVRDVRLSIETLKREEKSIDDGIKSIVNSNVIAGYKGDLFYTIDKNIPTQSNSYKSKIDKNEFPTLSGSTSDKKENTAATGSLKVELDSKSQIKDLLKQVSENQAKVISASGSIKK